MASPSRTRAVVIVSGLLIALPAAAQDAPAQPPPAPAAPAPQQDKPAPPPVRPMSMQPGAQSSQGPQQRPRRGAPVRKRGKSAPVIEGSAVASAPAFFRLDGGSTRISLEVSNKVDVGEGHAQGRLVFRLKGARVVERVNLLPLITGYFPTPVERAQLVQDDLGVSLVIELREATTPTHRVVETPRGMVLQVDFPRSTTYEQTQAPEPSRERAKRRMKTQSIGTDRSEESSD